MKAMLIFFEKEQKLVFEVKEVDIEEPNIHQLFPSPLETKAVFRGNIKCQYNFSRGKNGKVAWKKFLKNLE